MFCNGSVDWSAGALKIACRVVYTRLNQLRHRERQRQLPSYARMLLRNNGRKS